MRCRIKRLLPPLILRFEPLSILLSFSILLLSLTLKSLVPGATLPERRAMKVSLAVPSCRTRSGLGSEVNIYTQVLPQGTYFMRVASSPCVRGGILSEATGISAAPLLSLLGTRLFRL